MSLLSKLDSVKNFSTGLIKKKQLIYSILTSNMPKDLIEKKYLVVPQDVIEKELISQFEDDPHVSVRSVSCSGEQIVAALNVDKAGANVDFTVAFKISEGILNNERQRISLTVSDEKLHGNNIVGKIAAAFVNSFIKDILETSVPYSGLDSIISYDPALRLITADISGLDSIQTLRRPMKVVNKSILDLLSIGIDHHPEGVKLYIILPSEKTNSSPE